MNKRNVLLAVRNGMAKELFENETDRRIRAVYSERRERDILRNMLTDGDSVEKYLSDITEIRKSVKAEMEDAAGALDVGFDAEKKSAGILHRVADTETALSVAFVTMAEKGDIDGATASEHTDMFAPWRENVSYSAGAIRRHADRLYKCLQAHISQNTWTPDTAASLWSAIGDPAQEYPEWSAPVGAHDAYALGDKVSHAGIRWVSLLDSNVWEPGVYGWEESAK